MKISQKDIYSFGVDYIEVLGTLKKLDEINYGLKNIILNGDSLFPGFDIRRDDRVTNYSYKLVFNYKGIDCYAYHVGMENGAITTIDYLAIYGVAFVLFPELSEIIDFINNEMIYSKLRRFDLAVDVLIDIKTIHKNFKKLIQKGSIFFDEIGEVQTFYIGEKKKKNNRYKLIRVYNKIDDILIKKRQKIFPDYLIQKHITRIEIEIRSELAKNCTLNSLLDNRYIFNMFLTYITNYTEIFNGIKYEVTRLSQINKKVNIDDLKYNQTLKSRYINIFRGYAKTIIEIGGCPTDLLIREGLLTDDTKKDIVLAIKNGEFRQDMYEFGLNVRHTKNIFANNDEATDILYFDDEKYGLK